MIEMNKWTKIEYKKEKKETEKKIVFKNIF